MPFPALETLVFEEVQAWRNWCIPGAHGHLLVRGATVKQPSITASGWWNGSETDCIVQISYMIEKQVHILRLMGARFLTV